MEQNKPKQFDRRKSDIVFAEIHEEFDKIHKSIASMNTTMLSLVIAIKGDEFGNDGIIQRHNKLDNDFNHFKKSQSNTDLFQDKENKKKFEDHEHRITKLETSIEGKDKTDTTNWTRLQVIIGWISLAGMLVFSFFNFKGKE